MAQFVRPADTIIICENQWPTSDLHPRWLWAACPGVFSHPAGKVANFIFFDGHAKSKKWLATLYPVTQNNWQIDEPSQDPTNRQLSKMIGCDYLVPPGPDAKDFQTKDCQPVYQ
jgi:prepilin-type processing-associated H-X9-DG protein